MKIITGILGQLGAHETSSDINNENNYRQYLEIINGAISTLSEFLPKNIDGMTKEDYRIKYEHEGDIISPS